MPLPLWGRLDVGDGFLELRLRQAGDGLPAEVMGTGVDSRRRTATGHLGREDGMKIGTMLHVLESDGNCAVGFVTSHDPALDQISFVAVSDSSAESFGDHFLLGRSIVRDPAGEIELGERDVSWHSAEECPWDR